MTDIPKIGHYMLATLASNKVGQSEVSEIFEYIKNNPEYDGNDPKYKGYKLNDTLRKVCVELLDKYVVLNPKYEPLRDGVIFNAPHEESIIEALEILTKTRKSSLDTKTIKAVQQNFLLVREKLDIKDEEILRSGNIINNLKVAFRKII